MYQPASEGTALRERWEPTRAWISASRKSHGELL